MQAGRDFANLTRFGGDVCPGTVLSELLETEDRTRLRCLTA